MNEGSSSDQPGAEGREAGSSAVHVTEDYENALVAHYSRFFGDPSRIIIHEIKSVGVHIDTYIFPPNEERPFTTAATVGMGARPLETTEICASCKAALDASGAVAERHSELIMYLDPNWDFDDPVGLYPILMMTFVARSPHVDRHSFGWGMSYQFPERVVPEGSLLTNGYVMKPVWENVDGELDDFAIFEMPDGEVCNIYWLVPVTTAECYTLGPGFVIIPGWVRGTGRRACGTSGLHLVPLEDVPLKALTPAVVREWYATAMRGSGGRTSIKQSYRFLRAVMNTAVRDGAVMKNSCQIAGAGSDRAKERPVASPAEVVTLLEAITPRYRAAVLLAAWCGLRRGEIIGLRPEDVNVGSATVTVRRNRVELLENDRAAFDADPKTDAGKRTVAIPPHVLPVLAEHMASWAGPDRVFVGRNGRPMRGDAVRQAFGRARRKAGMPGFRFHDLRHTGQTLAAATGATTKDLMRRLGNASPAASYRYLHAVDGRDAEIASALSDLAAHGDAAKLPRSIVVKH